MHRVNESYLYRIRHRLGQQQKHTWHGLLLQRTPSFNRRKIQETRQYHNHVFFKYPYKR